MDWCPGCHKHFCNCFVLVIFKDVVECRYCGLIWVLESLDEFYRWYGYTSCGKDFSCFEKEENSSHERMFNT